MSTKHVCPLCGHDEFITVVHVSQDWCVDAHGNFLDVVENNDVVAKPNDDNSWTCAKCGAEAIIVDD